MSGGQFLAEAATGVARLTGVDEVPPASEIKPGWIALVIVLTLCVVTALLWLNMRKQLGKISFEEKDTRQRRRGEEPPGQ